MFTTKINHITLVQPLGSTLHHMHHISYHIPSHSKLDWLCNHWFCNFYVEYYTLLRVYFFPLQHVPHTLYLKCKRPLMFIFFSLPINICFSNQDENNNNNKKAVAVKLRSHAAGLSIALQVSETETVSISRGTNAIPVSLIREWDKSLRV